jgi:flagellar biosynthesis/type III secretory pathway M-ring protein FliF/YscJ
MQKHALASLPAPNTPAELASVKPEELLTAGSQEQPETNRKIARLREETVELIKEKPMNTAHAVQAWLHEESL